MTPKAVIHDIGNVLIGWQPERYYDRRIGPQRRAALFGETGVEAMNLAVDGGAPFRETVYGLAEKHPNWAEEIRWWYDDWAGLASPRIEHSITLLRRLRAKGVPVFVLSNIGDEVFSHAQTQYDFLRWFDRAYVSGRMNLTKPDPAIYAAVERDCGIAPEALLFVDDKPENTAAAAARGWQTHLFTTADGWADKLCQAGLLTAEEATP
ncbi:HAD family phosphatase [Pseudorhodobacter sp.]|uniref:HAD family hydrolase n=1 Tax=Pseudorhodobacter sp. TaxID=1934400 RepID=UPI002648FF83|nr:HAD family phosphatase [Pseudorhodobacter sp.]MDN5786678.1 HAD family phosphatase [Pseudorhodobacter sp.]